MSESTQLPHEPTASAMEGGGRWKKHLADLVTITVGVLIALSLEGVRQWMNDRELVREAEATLLVEIEENRDEIERVLEGDSLRQAALESAIRFVDELLENGATEVSELNLGFTLGEVSASSWTTAERTGALALMDYDRVRQLSRAYEAQDLFIDQQRQTLARLAAATAMMAGGTDPTEAGEEDLRSFRTEVLGLRAELFIQRQLAERTKALYENVLTAAGR